MGEGQGLSHPQRLVNLHLAALFQHVQQAPASNYRNMSVIGASSSICGGAQTWRRFRRARPPLSHPLTVHTVHGTHKYSDLELAAVADPKGHGTGPLRSPQAPAV